MRKLNPGSIPYLMISADPEENFVHEILCVVAVLSMFYESKCKYELTKNKN